MGSIRYWLHRLVVLTSLLQFVRALDPGPALGIFAVRESLYLSRNVTCMLLLCGVFTYFRILDGYYTALQTRMPAWITLVLFVTIPGAFVTGNLVTTLSYWMTDRFVVSGIFLIYLALTELLWFGLYAYGVYGWDRVFKEMSARLDGAQRIDTQHFTRARRKLVKLVLISFFVFVVAITFQLRNAISFVGEDEVLETNPDEFDASELPLAILQQCVIVVLLWYAWIPVHVGALHCGECCRMRKETGTLSRIGDEPTVTGHAAPVKRVSTTTIDGEEMRAGPSHIPKNLSLSYSSQPLQEPQA